MKTYKFYGLVGGLLLVFFSCGDKKNTPEYVMEAFTKAFTQYKFDEAVQYSTSQTHSLLDMMKGMTELLSEKDRPKPEAWQPLKDIKCVVTKDTLADCTCLDTKTNERTKEPIKLVKRKGKWLVNMTKDDIQSKP